MKSNLTSLSLFSFLFVGLFLASFSVHATRVIEGSLGTWIAQDVSPKLSELLTRHPRFKGEPIKIMAMSDGLPIAINDKLTDKIREQLTQDLLSSTEVKIVFDDINRCRPIKVNTILGIEVQKHNSGNHRVLLAMVDTEEGIWLNGTNISWNGKLTSSQRRAFKSRVQHPAATSILASYQTSEIAESLYAQLQCNEEIVPPVFFEPASDNSSQAVLRSLREKVSKTLLTTIDKNIAVSIISLQSPDQYPEDNGSQHPGTILGTYILGLATINDPSQVHRIGEVMVSGARNSGTTNSGLKLTYADNADSPSSDILSEIQIVSHYSRHNACKSGNEECVDISFDLKRPAYTVLFYSVGGQVAPLDCQPPKHRQAGKQFYGLNVPAGHHPGRPSVGFYALAFKDRSAARQVHTAISQNAPKCGGQQDRDGTWVVSLGQLLDLNNEKFRGRTDWQAIHLTRTNTRVTEL